MIPENVETEVTKVTDKIINYQNINKLSWMEVYKDVLKSLNIEDKYNDNTFLNSVIRKITILGYDIEAYPFKLERFR